MKVAILVPTKNRPDFIQRMLSYYNLINSPHPILIGDASDETTSQKIKNIINEFKNLEVKYFHWENVGCNQTIFQLTEKALPDYQYCVPVGDDDFLIPSSLSKCALFLSNNPDYRTAQGRAAYIRLDRPGAFGRIEYAGQQWGSREYKQDKGTQRFLTLFKNYSAYDFCTHRTNEYLQDSDYYFKIEDIILGEIFRSYMFAIRGKSKFIDCLYSVFHFHTQHHVSQNPVKWIFQENFGKDFYKIIDALGKALYSMGEFSEVKSKEFVHQKFFEMINESMLGWGDRNKVQYSKKLKQMIPPNIKTNLMIIRDHIRNIYNQDGSDLKLMNLKKSKYYNDFLPIIESTLKI